MLFIGTVSGLTVAFWILVNDFPTGEDRFLIFWFKIKVSLKACFRDVLMLSSCGRLESESYSFLWSDCIPKNEVRFQRKVVEQRSPAYPHCFGDLL